MIFYVFLNIILSVGWDICTKQFVQNVYYLINLIVQCCSSRLFYSSRLCSVCFWPYPVLLGHIWISGTLRRLKLSISPSSPNTPATWAGEGEFEDPEFWSPLLHLEMNPQRACAPIEILDPMLNTQDHHLSHPRPLHPIILGESLTWMSPTILIQTMRHPHLRMSCWGESRPPPGVQPRLFALTSGRSRRKGRCFLGRSLLQIKLLSEISEQI